MHDFQFNAIGTVRLHTYTRTEVLKSRVLCLIDFVHLLAHLLHVGQQVTLDVESFEPLQIPIKLANQPSLSHDLEVTEGALVLLDHGKVVRLSIGCALGRKLIHGPPTCTTPGLIANCRVRFRP